MREIPDNDAIAIFGLIAFALPFITKLAQGKICDWVDLLAYYIACGLYAGVAMYAMWYAIKIGREKHGKNKDDQ